MLAFVLAAALASCPVSPVIDPYPDIIGPITGTDPVWLIDGSSRRWSGPDQVVKTLWVISKKAAGDLRIEGRRLDGDGVARFQDGGVTGTPKTTLEIPEPEWRRRAWPGNATADVRRDFAFVPDYVIYPGPGCWEFTARIGSVESRVTIAMK
jgi:hypothetical protein